MSALQHDLVTLRLLLAVAKAGSIARAAELESIAASAISKRISELELRVGTALFNRMPSGVRPTEAGEVMIRHASTIVANLARMDAELSEFSKGEHGDIRVLANSSSIAISLASDLIAFSHDHPDISLHLEESGSPMIVRSVSEGIADIGVYAGNVDHGELEIMPYRKIDLMLVVPMKHPLADAKEVSFSETFQYDYVGLHESNSLSRLVMTGALSENHRQRFHIRARSFETIGNLVEAGAGISILPNSHCMSYQNSKSVKCIYLTDSWSRLDINMCYRSFDQLPRSAKLLIEYCCHQTQMAC